MTGAVAQLSKKWLNEGIIKKHTYTFYLKTCNIFIDSSFDV